MNYAHDKVMLKTQDLLNRRHTHCYNSPNQALQCRAMHVNTCYMRNLTTWHCLHSSIATRQWSLRKSCKAASMAVSPRDNSFPSKWQTNVQLYATNPPLTHFPPATPVNPIDKHNGLVNGESRNSIRVLNINTRHATHTQTCTQFLIPVHLGRADRRGVWDDHA